MRSIPERSGADKAYGETRYTWGTTPTDYRFTGQRQTESLALIHMGARWYDPYLGRWLSPDSIVPEPGNPQALNRYSYGYNNSLKFRDPSGHQPAGPCKEGENCEEPPEWWVQLLADPEFQAWLATVSQDLVWELVPSAIGVYGDFGWAFGACFEGGMSGQFSLQLNWRSGELTFLYGPSADLYLGTPRVVSLFAGAGGVGRGVPPGMRL